MAQEKTVGKDVHGKFQKGREQEDTIIKGFRAWVMCHKGCLQNDIYDSKDFLLK